MMTDMVITVAKPIVAILNKKISVAGISVRVH